MIDIKLVPHPMKARAHRGGFEDSMATMTLIQESWDSVIEWACKLQPDIDPEIVRSNITVDTVFSNDIRNGWAHTRTVAVVGYGVIGYVDWKTP